MTEAFITSKLTEDTNQGYQVEVEVEQGLIGRYSITLYSGYCPSVGAAYTAAQNEVGSLAQAVRVNLEEAAIDELNSLGTVLEMNNGF